MTLTHSRSSVANQRLFVICDGLVSLSTMSLVSNSLRACSTLLGIVALAWYGPHGGAHFVVSGHLSCFHVLTFNVGRCREHGRHFEICPPLLPRALLMNGFVGSRGSSLAHLLGHLYPGLGCHFAILHSSHLVMPRRARPAPTARKSPRP